MAGQPIAVGVVGASARAAVHSLLRAGFSAWAVDLFGDRDLTRVAPFAVCPLEDYPAALPRLADQFPPGPVMYTGGLENHPDVVSELARKREVFGTGPERLHRVRDPWWLFPTLAGAGFETPALVPRGDPCPVIGRWLRKPLRSAGGLGVRFANPAEPASPHHYFQEFIDGTPMSAHFVSDLAETPFWPDGTDLFGVTEQLIGEPWLHARPFAYCGNVGPIKLPDHAEAKVSGDALVANRSMGLLGLWGVDFILRSGTPYPVEVNPRPTAAAEVLDLSTRTSGITTHCECFSTSFALARYKIPRRYESPVGKAIYYAPRKLTFPEGGPWDEDLAGEFDPWRLPAFADIPHPGAEFAPGQPVITILVSGSSPAECRERLQSRAGELDQLFGVTPL